MSSFIKGMDLCESFFNEIAKPISDKNFPLLTYSAGLIGYGSDVLGYDDEISTHHMWGPRFYLFVDEKDKLLKDKILDSFSKEFPYLYRGYSVNFSEPNLNYVGVRQPKIISSGLVSQLIFIYTIDEYLNEYLGISDFDNLNYDDWLAFSEHRLLALTSGKFFVDDLKRGVKFDRIKFYPRQIKLFLIASNWSLIAEEQAFIKRCSDIGDELGSMLVCSRIAERLMRLCFLYCNQYAPYSKWFGKAFSLLQIDDKIKVTIQNAVKVQNIIERENNIVLAQKMIADLHNYLRLTENIDIEIQSYYGRDIKVIFADKIFEETAKLLKDSPLADYPFIGTLSEVANLSYVSDEPNYRENIKKLYTK